MKRTLLLAMVMLPLTSLFSYEYQNFGTHQRAMKYYLNTHKMKEYIRPRFGKIKLAVFYPKSKRRVMIVQFRDSGKLVIHEGIPLLTWFNMKEHKSPDQFYLHQIQGKYKFDLKAKK